jgi:hypothetical protein
MKIFLILPLAISLLAACASNMPIQVEGVQIADETQVTHCKYLDNVHGASGWYGLVARKGLENARLYALRQARKIGATHIVWVPAAQSSFSSQAEGKAYLCTTKASRM